MKEKIAITGGAGFIGACLAKRFAKDGFDVLVLDNFIRGSADRLMGIEGIELAQVDILHLEALSTAVKGCKAVFHLAAINGTENFYNIPDQVLEVGVKGILNVMDACYAQGIKELVIASSAEAYQTPSVIPTPERETLKVPDPSNPRYSYGASKLISEVIAFNFYREHFTKLQIFRPHNIYGPDMGTKHVIPQLILKALRLNEQFPVGGISFPIQGEGSETRAFCYIDDLVEAFCVMYHRGGHREIYHLGNPEEVSINSLVEAVFEHVGRPYTLEHTPLTEGSALRRCPDISKIEALGFSPSISLKKGIQLTFRWYADHYKHIDTSNTLI
jgi:UDP-glucose 4-epimerase